MAKVTHVCKRTVVSTKPVPPGKYHPLSVLDRVMEKNNLRMVFYYPSMRSYHNDDDDDDDQTVINVGRLRESLAEMLTSFPAVTGRLQENDKNGEWMIKCNDAGVRMVEARAQGSVEHWLSCVDRGRELNLVYWEELYHKPYFWSTFYVQITEFEEGGLAIGLSCIHLLADLTCATMIINSWAQTTFYGKMLASYFHPLPPRKLGNKKSNHVPYTPLTNHYKSTIERSKTIPIVNTKYTTLSLAFADHNVRACINAAQMIDKAHQIGPSPFEALAGLFWVCISKAKGIADRLLNMSVCLDMRRVLNVDKRFFGNCMVYNEVNPKGVLENDLSEAAKAIGEVVVKMDNEGVMDLIEWLQCSKKIDAPLMNNCDLVCSYLDVVDPYLAVFGDKVAPIRVSYYVEPVLGLGQVLILPGPPKEGPLSKVVMVTLPEDELMRLCEDDLLLSFSPTILMGLNKN
ncbi:protein ECERIFERUM 26-like [Humulus lupulus]|uniref:protein ECERIFERUM 26-like n=1 Tax=Humulus lupulus TaxID=3486 RepID=UPI002B404FC8|nr:protein ECERIFERUM 26-like [Humulus lupulus]